MGQLKKVTIYSQVYNTKGMVERCIESVLCQSYENFEYIIMDNGCTDGCSELLTWFAQRDSRIILLRRKTNQRKLWIPMIREIATGYYFSTLDSDDWWEPNYLERLVTLAEENKLDIACTGSYTYEEESGERRRYISAANSLIIQNHQFQNEFTKYYPFFRAMWGKLFRLEMMQHHIVTPYHYHNDTICCFSILPHAKRIGIDASILHTYRIHKGAITYKYDSEMVPANFYVYEKCINFLASFGPITHENQKILRDYFIIDMSIVLNSVKNSSLNTQDKLHEYWKALNHPLSQEILQQQFESIEDISYFGPIKPTILNMAKNLEDLIWTTELSAHDRLHEYRIFLSNPLMHAIDCDEWDTLEKQVQRIQAVLESGTELLGHDDTDLCAIMKILAPHCGAAVNEQNARRFLEDRTWFRSQVGDQALWSFYMRHHRTFMLLFGSQSPLQRLPGTSVPLLQALIEDRPAPMFRRLSRLAKRKRHREEPGLMAAIQEICRAADGELQ